MFAHPVVTLLPLPRQSRPISSNYRWKLWEHPWVNYIEDIFIFVENRAKDFPFEELSWMLCFTQCMTENYPESSLSELAWTTMLLFADWCLLLHSAENEAKQRLLLSGVECSRGKVRMRECVAIHTNFTASKIAVENCLWLASILCTLGWYRL